MAIPKMNKDNQINGDYQILALDVGQKRIGVARAQNQVRLVEPLMIISVSDGEEFAKLRELFDSWQPAVLVIGLPLNESGEQSKQANLIREWVKIMVIKTGFTGRLVYQDETLSSHAARADSPKERFIDDLAAALILGDCIDQNRGENI